MTRAGVSGAVEDAGTGGGDELTRSGSKARKRELSQSFLAKFVRLHGILFTAPGADTTRDSAGASTGANASAVTDADTQFMQLFDGAIDEFRLLLDSSGCSDQLLLKIVVINIFSVICISPINITI